MSHPGPQVDVAGFDKVEHFCYFCAGGVSVSLALFYGKRPVWRPLVSGLVVVGIGAATGWVDEWHQSFTPGRSGLDVYDWLADVAGSVAAVPVSGWLRRRFLTPRDGEHGDLP